MNAKNKTKVVSNEMLPEFLKEQLKTIDKLQERNNMLSSDFEIEKNCKNQAYFFILESGYFDEYVDYTKANPVQPVQAR